MKKYPILLLVLLLPFLVPEPTSVVERPVAEVIVEIEPKAIEVITIGNNLIPAMIQVESLGNDSAIGDTHLVGNEAVGALQIRPIMIREVNRILKIQKSKNRFKRKDRYSRTKSIEMFLVWKNYHHPEGGFETIARNWNGGPRGYKNKRTEYYWSKIQKELALIAN
jgi:hypothetical protein